VGGNPSSSLLSTGTSLVAFELVYGSKLGKMNASESDNRSSPHEPLLAAAATAANATFESLTSGFVAAYCCLMSVPFLLNCYVVAVYEVLCGKHDYPPACLLTASMAVANLCAAVVAIATMISYYLAASALNDTISSSLSVAAHVCAASQTLIVVFTMIVVWSLLCVNVDRWWYFSKPLQYPVVFTARTARYLTAASWLLPALVNGFKYASTAIQLGLRDSSTCGGRKTEDILAATPVANFLLWMGFLIPGVTSVALSISIARQAIRLDRDSGDSRAHRRGDSIVLKRCLYVLCTTMITSLTYVPYFSFSIVGLFVSYPPALNTLLRILFRVMIVVQLTADPVITLVYHPDFRAARVRLMIMLRGLVADGNRVEPYTNPR
jgi:7 transmembrane receptor (rhodopsin family)